MPCDWWTAEDTQGCGSGGEELGRPHTLLCPACCPCPWSLCTLGGLTDEEAAKVEVGLVQFEQRVSGLPNQQERDCDVVFGD